MSSKFRFITTYALASVALAACGGGGDGGPQVAAPPVVVAPPPPDPVGNTWQAGRFEPASQFKDQCAVPRTGTDSNGNRYPDVAGTLSDELFWLRSWSDETYLWYDEIPDQNPDSFTSTLSYFEELKTNATTVNGNPKDRFHFTYTTEEWERIRAGTSSGYGARFTILQSSPPRDIRVAFVEPGSPAAAAGLDRGDRIVTADGVDVVNGTDVDAINSAIFLHENGEEHVFEIESRDGVSSTVTLTSGPVVQSPVNVVRTFEQNGRRYGYLHFTTFSPDTSEVAIFDAFDQLQAAGIDDMVLDLRYNGGGKSSVASQLSYMIAGPDRTRGLTFALLEFNDKAGDRDPVTGELIRPTPFYDTGQGFTVPSSRRASSVSKPRVFVLTTSRSCSASEAVMNALRGIDVEVIQIGTGTCGKPYGFYATPNCGTTYFTIQLRLVNAKGFGDYADGFEPGKPVGSLGDVMPGCTVADDFDKALGDPSEAMLSAALTYAETGSCPTAARKVVSDDERNDIAIETGEHDLWNDPRLQALEYARTLDIGDTQGGLR
ncbi:MAG: S41 family peptidase [Pseudomonadota bacterium]